MNHAIQLCDMKISNNVADTFTAKDLGSGVVIALHYPETKKTGVIYFMLPDSKVDAGLAKKKPYMFADQGVALFLDLFFNNSEEWYWLKRSQIMAHIVGGADLLSCSYGPFAIGQQNVQMALEIIKKHDLKVGEVEVGGHQLRHMTMEVKTGELHIKHDLIADRTRIDHA